MAAKRGRQIPRTRPQAEHEHPLALHRPPAFLDFDDPPPELELGRRDLRGTKPREAEIACISDAVEDLQRFARYPAVFGSTAPRHDVMLDLFETAAEWSMARVRLQKWDAVCASKEQKAWAALRQAMKTFRPAFAMASANDVALAEEFSRLQQLLTAMSHITRKGASSRKENRAAEAEGKPPVKGKRAEAAKRASLKKALGR